MYKEDIEQIAPRLEILVKECLHRKLLPEINDLGFALLVEALKKFQSWSEVANAVPGLLDVFQQALERGGG